MAHARLPWTLTAFTVGSLVASGCGASGPPSAPLATLPSTHLAGPLDFAESFVVPFAFRIPLGSGVRFDEAVSSDHVQVFSGPGETGGFVVWAVEETLADPCEPDGDRVAVDGGANSLVDYIGSIDQITIVSQTEEVVDGHPATVLELAATAGSGCSVVSLWPDSATPSQTTMSIAEDGTATVRIFEVDEATIAFETFSGPGDDGSWAAVVAELVESIHFVAPD